MPDDEKEEAELRRLEAESHAKLDAVFDEAKLKQAAEDDTTRQLQELMKDIPSVPKKGDKISRREVAESIARCSRGDFSNRAVSEEEIQKALKWMDWYDAGKSKPLEKGLHIAGSLLVPGGIFSIAMSILGMSKMLGYLGPIMVVLGIGCWLARDWKKDKRIKNLPPPQ